MSHHEQNFTSDRYMSLANLTQAIVSVGMETAREYQLGSLSYYSEADLRAANQHISIVTASEEKMRDYVEFRGQNVAILGEMTGQEDDELEMDYALLLAPLDGARAAKSRAPTSTVVASLVDSDFRLVASTIGEPATGRIWHAQGGDVTRSLVYREHVNRDINSGKTRVWRGSVHDDATVFLDNLTPYTDLHKREILRKENLVHLLGSLVTEVHMHNYGTTTLHNALVANGREQVAGAITTSVSGPWDLGGALHVVNAGGVVEMYNLNKDRELVTNNNPLVPFNVDMMISGNDQQTVDFLREKVIESLQVAD